MKRERTLRQNITFFLMLALVLPMLCFALISQFRIWRVSGYHMDESVANDVHAINTTLDMVLNKYATILYDFCTDEEVVRLVESINQNQGELDINSSQLRRKLIHLSNRTDGVEGVTLVTASDRVMFYDGMMASSIASTWAGRVTAPDIQKGELFSVADQAVHTEDGNIYLYQVARRLVDYRDINRQIGTVVLSINAETLNSVVSREGSVETFLCENGKIVASARPCNWMQDISSIDTENKKIQSIVNQTSGWTVYEYYSMEAYLEALHGQTAFWIVLAVFMAVLLVGAVWHVTDPILSKVEGLVRAMNQVENGDFNVQLSNSGHLPKEVRRIVDVFNGMVKQLNRLMEQVKQSAIDQKNAEISAMEAQIDPHFLYNTLDTINWKALEKNDYEVSSMVGALADILRYSIRNPGDTVSIGQVLYWTEQYIMLQSKKLEAPLELDIDVPDEIRNYRIHKLLLQPFVENAIRHGFYQKKDVCRLGISIGVTEEQMHIIIKDNGRGIAPWTLAMLNDEQNDMAGHVGLSNVRKRLKLYYGDDATVYFESKEGFYTKIHLFVNVLGGEEKMQ